MIIRKLPTAWLQLRYQRMRLIVALSSVVFAVVIIFMQLGVRDALFDSSVRFYEGLEGDCFLISPPYNALISREQFTERRLLQALAFPEVEFVSPIYLEFAQWKNPQTKTDWRRIFVIGIDLRYRILNLPGVSENIDKLKPLDTVLFDRNSRNQFGLDTSEFNRQGKVTTELRMAGTTRKFEVVGLFELGTSFGADGNLLMSHLNFLRIFQTRDRGIIDLGLIKLKPGADVEKYVMKLRKYLPEDVKVLSKEELIKFEKKYWDSSQPIGFIFNFGALLGVIVGIVVVYQILYTNVSEHIPEYATLKAMGYRHQYLLSMVLQQALFVSIAGYIPGLLIAAILYKFVQAATFLPFVMTFKNAFFVLALTVTMCFIAGATAVRKLKTVDPADIF